MNWGNHFANSLPPGFTEAMISVRRDPAGVGKTIDPPLVEAGTV